MVEWIKIHDPSICYLQETQNQRHKQVEKIILENSTQKRSGVTILLSNKVDFKSRETKDIVCEYSKKIEHLNLYAPNDRSSKYMKQKLTELKGEIVLQ